MLVRAETYCYFRLEDKNSLTSSAPRRLDDVDFSVFTQNGKGLITLSDKKNRSDFSVSDSPRFDGDDGFMSFVGVELSVAEECGVAEYYVLG